MISIFLNFKVVKAKNAALLAGVAFFYSWKLIVNKMTTIVILVNLLGALAVLKIKEAS